MGKEKKRFIFHLSFDISPLSLVLLPGVKPFKLGKFTRQEASGVSRKTLKIVLGRGSSNFASLCWEGGKRSAPPLKIQ